MSRFLAAVNRFKFVILVYLVLAFLLWPLIKLSMHNVPMADDFIYGLPAKHAYVETGSVFAAVKAAASVVADKYMNWQGSYSSIFLMALQPEVFSMSLYHFAAILLIVFTVLAPVFLALVINKYYLKADVRALLIAVAAYVATIFSYMPSIMQGIYWFNSAYYYTFTFDMALCYIAIMILFSNTNKKRARWIYFSLLILMSIMLAGTNYPFILAAAICYPVFVLTALIKRAKYRWYYFGFCIFFGVLAAVNVFAPGNLGQSALKTHASIPMTLFLMLTDFSAEMADWSRIPITIVSAVLIIPFSGKFVSNSKIKFAHPVLTILFSAFLLYSQYAMAEFVFKNSGPARAINIRFMLFHLLILANTINLLGYLKQKGKMPEKQNAALSILLAFSLLASSTAANPLEGSWPLIAVNNDIYLHTQEFSEAMNQRFAALYDDSIKDVEVEHIESFPMLYDSDMWKYYKPTDYYQKNSIKTGD